MKSKKEKRMEAEARQKEYDKLTLKQKIDRAINRRGNSTKELKRLYNGKEV